MIRIITAALAVLASTAVADAQQYDTEQPARACVHSRLSELISRDQRQDVMADPALRACTNPFRDELQAKGKNFCEATDYTLWLVANENSKLFGASGSPYRQNKTFIRRCNESTTRKKHP